MSSKSTFLRLLKTFALGCLVAHRASAQLNPVVVPYDPEYPPPPSPCCETCMESDPGNGGSCSLLPTCVEGGSVFFSVGLGRTGFTRDMSFASAMAKTGKQDYIASRIPGGLQDIASFYTRSPLTGMRTFFVWYHEDSLTSASFEPSSLIADPGADSERIQLGTAIRQVLTKDYFADIQPLADVRATLPTDIKSTSEIPTGAPGFVIRTWFAGEQTAKVDGLYGLPSGEPLGYVVFYRKAETSSPPDWSRTLGIIHRVKSSSAAYKTQSWTHLNDNLGNWTTVHYRDLPSGDVKLSRNTRTVTSRTSANEFVQTNTTEEAALSATGALGALVLVSSTEEEFNDVGDLKRLVRRTLGSNLAASRQRTSLYGWINNTSNAAIHGRPQWEYHPDGSFVHHTYSFSVGAGSGSIITRRPWKDTTWTPGSTAPADSGCVVETTSFTATAMTVSRKVNNTDLISSEETTWSTDGSGFKVLTEKTRYGSNVGDVLTTTTGYNPSTAAAHLANRIAWRVQQDGSAEKYTYTSPDGSGNYTQTVDAGAGSATSITQGRKSVSSRNQKGHVTSRTEKWFKTGTGATEITLSTWVVDNVPYGGGTLNAFDFLGRPQGKVHNSNTNDYEAIIHGCCGVAYERDRSGRITEYFQDEMHRVYKTVETTGAVVKTTTTARASEVGFAGMVTETRRSAGALDLLVAKRWSTTNGELDKSESPDQDGVNGAETTIYAYSYPGTGRSVTVTRPDNSTSISSYYADRRMKSVSGTGVSDASYDYATHTEQGGGIVSTHTRLTSTGGTTEWTKTYTDLAGRTFRVEYPTEIQASPTKDRSTTTYHLHTAGAGSRGKPATMVDPDGVTRSYAYDAEGGLLQVTEPIPGGLSRVTQTLRDAVTDATLGGSLRTITKLNTVTISTSLQGGNGYGSSENSFGRITTSIRTVAVAGDWTETTTHPDGTRTVSIYADGRLDLVENRDNTGVSGALVSSTSYGYDALGRMTSTVDSRTGTTTLSDLTESGNVRTMTDAGTRVTTFAFDSMGRRTSVDAPDTTFNNITNTSYTARGEVEAEWGDNTYPTFRTYDEQGRLLTLRTKPTLDGNGVPTDAGGSFTSWSFDSQRGWLNAKEYPDGQDAGSARDPGPSYTYTAAGRLRTRTWGGGKHTRYDYRQGLLVAKRHFTAATADNGTNAGNDPETPDVGQSYNNRGQLANVISNGTANHPGTRILYVYDSANFRVTRELQQIDPDVGFTLGVANSGVVISLGTIPATISRYVHRKADAILRNTGADVRETLAPTSTLYVGSTLAYDAEDGRLATVTGDFVGSTAAYDYTYQANSTSDLPDTITGPVHTVDNHWESTRDALDWKQNKVGSTTVSKYDYTVNDIGQRTSVAATGSAFSTAPDWNWGYNARGELVSTQHLNTTGSSRHYTFDAIGNRTEHREGTHTSSGGTATSYTPNEVNQYDAIGSLNPVHDLDGNMTSGPLPVVPGANSSLEWDGNNQLIELTPSVGSTVKYHYDPMGRRIARTVGSTRTYWTYDGWNPVAEFSGAVHTTGTAPALTLEKTWLWGPDLSGSLQGAGGVGGLLAVDLETGGTAGVYHPLFDGNGNIGQYLDGSGNAVAKYEYDGFGRSLISTGSHVTLFPHRFSTKMLDAESGLYYYGYRYYDPVTGRWPSRDPIEENGGINIYGFNENSSTSSVDPIGLSLHLLLEALEETLVTILEIKHKKTEVEVGEKVKKKAEDIVGPYNEMNRKLLNDINDLDDPIPSPPASRPNKWKICEYECQLIKDKSSSDCYTPSGGIFNSCAYGNCRLVREFGHDGASCPDPWGEEVWSLPMTDDSGARYCAPTTKTTFTINF